MSVNSFEPNDTTAYVWRLTLGSIAIASAVIGLSLWLFWDGLEVMGSGWLNSPEYSYCLLIPPIAAFLVWQQKDRLELMPFNGSWWGVAVVIFGGGLLVLGQFATIYTLVQYAYLVTLYGLVLSFTGPQAFRLIAVPLLILAFMVPLPNFIFANLSLQLQLWSSDLGVWFMRLLGISVFVEGNVIDLGGYKLQVAEACDGLRYLFPMMTLAFLIAYFYRGAWWKRAVVFLSSLPITVVMNSWRVGTIGFMVEHWGIGMAEGFLHEFQGWMVFMLSSALLISEMMLLNRIGHENGHWRELFGVEFPAATPAGKISRRRPIPVSFISAAGVLVVFVIVALMTPRPAEIFPSRLSFSEFPLHLGPWIGRTQSMEGVFLDQLKIDDYLLANYSDGASTTVNLYMAYYNSQRKGEAVHSPRSCLPGGGWQLRDFGQRTIAGVTIDGRPLRVNRTIIELGTQRQLVYYWFQQRGRIVTNEFAVKWYLFWDALTRHRTDGALVRLIVQIPPASNEAEADRSLVDLTRRVAPIITRYVPD
jgi:exosortase D (VPLPA-CTERM-specific)